MLLVAVISVIFRLEIPLVTSLVGVWSPGVVPLLGAFLGPGVLGALGAAGAVFLPANGEKLELVHQFVLPKFEPFAWAANTISSGLGSAKTEAWNEEEEV